MPKIAGSDLKNCLRSFSVIKLLNCHPDYGYAPNPAMENVFMAVAMDTYDEPNTIHPKYKQIVGERLSISGGNIAYGLDTPTNGPVPESIDVADNIADITYDKGGDSIGFLAQDDL